jgi:hypothetical protein
MSALYSTTNLTRRKTIINAHPLIGCLVNANIVNTLIHLFDKDDTYTNDKISKYIADERFARGLSSSNIKIKNEVYGNNKNNSTLYLGITKNDVEYIHLTIHLCPKSLEPKHAGMIHIKRNAKLPGITNRQSYILLKLDWNQQKPNSLIFSVVDNGFIKDAEMDEEMDVIITVLNRLFDEDNTEFYVGNPDRLLPIHNKTNSVLMNMNQHTPFIKRKNVGVMMYPPMVNNAPITLKPRTTTRRNTNTRNRRTTRRQTTQ